MTVWVTEELKFFLRDDKGALLRQDVEAWFRWKMGKPAQNDEELFEFLEKILASWEFEFRNIVDFRLGQVGWWSVRPNLDQRREQTLWIMSKDIGGGLIIQHGNSTRIYAEKIGNNLWVNQNVTIGSSGRGAPTIGNNVRIFTGAVVVGPIRIGNGVTITANAVVTFDVPDGSTVYAARSVVASRDGTKAHAPLGPETPSSSTDSIARSANETGKAASEPAAVALSASSGSLQAAAREGGAASLAIKTGLRSAVNVTGFMYSGKSAIWEAFQQSGFFETPPGVETRFGRFPGGVLTLFSALVEKKPLGIDEKILATNLFLGSLEKHNLSEGWLAEGWAKWHRPEDRGWCNTDTRAARTKYGAPYDRIFMALIDYVFSRHVGESPDALLRHFRSFFFHLNETIKETAGKKLVLYNNLFHPELFFRACIYDPLYLIVVDRDIRDVFTDQMQEGIYGGEGGDNYQTAIARFLDKQKRSRSGLPITVPKSFQDVGFIETGTTRPIMYLSFERFVSDDGMRNEIYKRVGMEDVHAMRVESKFDFQKSMKNIGKYKSSNIPDAVFQTLIDGLESSNIPYTVNG